MRLCPWVLVESIGTLLTACSSVEKTNWPIHVTQEGNKLTPHFQLSTAPYSPCLLWFFSHDSLSTPILGWGRMACFHGRASLLMMGEGLLAG